MNSGYYAACAGLQAQTKALDLIANNLANLSTTGYRAQQPLFRSSLEVANREEMDPLNRAVNDFDVLAGSQVDLRAGNMVRTGNSLDLAIEGTGFFAVQTKAGTLYTRNGNFQVSRDGHLVTGEGDFVLGDQGPVSVPAGTISISPDGVLSVDGAVSARLRISDLDPAAVPVPVGKQYFSIPAKSVRPAAESYVRQGILESSNVSAVSAIVDLITLQRRAEMLQHAMSAFYSNLDHVAASDLPHV